MGRTIKPQTPAFPAQLERYQDEHPDQDKLIGPKILAREDNGEVVE